MFWIDASSQENAESDFASIGRQVGKGATFAAGLHWLSQCSTPWLLVIDNADDPDMDVSKFFPGGACGHILITTRNPDVIIHATAGSFRFHGMDPEEAMNLLLKAASWQTNPESPNPQDQDNRALAKGIASELGYLALALAHAGATIRRKIYTLERYLHYYLGHRRRMLSCPQIQSADEANIIATWELPFRRMEKRHSQEYRDAVGLMYILSFMHFESIPERIFQRSWNGVKALKGIDPQRFSILHIQSAWNDEAQARLRRAAHVLSEHSLIDHEPRKGVYSIHPVVHQWARERLDEAEQRQWLNCATAVLAHCISPIMEASGQQFRRLLIPHMNSNLQALRLHFPSLLETADRAVELDRFASVFAENGLWKQAQALQRQVVDFRLRTHGGRHENTLQAMRSLAFTEWNLFEIRSSIEWQRQILSTRWKFRPSMADWLTWPPWKPNHVPYCIALDDLTLTLWLAGKRDISKRTGEASLRGLTRRLGPNDPRTLSAAFNLARTYLHLGETAKSHWLLTRVVRTRKHFFGADHPDTLMARNELGMCLCAQRRHLPAAERLVANVLTARRRLLGDEHAYTLWSVNDLTKVLCERERAAEAVAMLEDTIPVVARTLGENHVGMSMTRSNLARAYFLCERWADAEGLTRGLLEQVPGDHPDWVHIMSGFVFLLVRRGRLEEAEANCCRALDLITKEKVLAMDSPRTVIIGQQLIEVYRKQGREGDVEALKKRIPVVREEDGGRRFSMMPIGRVLSGFRERDTNVVEK